MKKTGMLALVFTLILSLFTPAFVGAETSFKDVDKDFWAADQINHFSNAGVIKGYGDGTFKPNRAVTRGEAAVMLARALELNTDDVDAVTYEDIDQDHPYYKEIAAVTSEGIMQGKPGGVFDSNGNLQRAHMAIMIANAFELHPDQKANFSDVADDFYAVDEINAIYAHGITTGYEDGTFKPTNPTTRAHFVTFLDRVLNPAEKTDLTALLKEVYANEMALESYEFEGSATFGLTLPESFFEMPDMEDFEIDPELLELDPELGEIEIPELTEEELAELEQGLELIRQLLSHIEVDVKGTYQLEPMLLEAEVNVNIPGDIGFSLNMPMVMTDTKMWMKFPENSPLFPMPEEVAGKYIEFDLESLANLNELDEDIVPPMNLDWDLQTELAAAVYDLFFDHFGKDFYHEASADDIEIPSGIEVDQVVKFELTNDNLQSFVEILFKGFVPAFFDLVTENPDLAEAIGFTPEMMEEMDFVVEEMTEFIDEMVSSIGEFVKINAFDEYIVINSDKHIVYDLIDMDVEVNFAGDTFGLKLKSDATKTNINGDVKFEHGIPNPEDVITFEELLELELEAEEEAA